MNERYTAAILDNSPECIVLIGKDQRVLAFNKTIKNVLFEYFNREIKLGDFYYPDFVIESNQEIYLNAFSKALKGEETVLQQLTENNSASFWFEYKTNPIYDNNNELIGVTLSAINITTKKLAELEVTSINKKMKAILK